MKRTASRPTEFLTLKKRSDGYYRTTWTDLMGVPHQRSFGSNRVHALNEFNRFHALWRRDPSVRTPGSASNLTVRQAWERFDKWARSYYVKRGVETGEADNITVAMREVLALFGDSPAFTFDVACLARVRNEMVRAGLTVQGINKRIAKVRQVWRWFVSQQIVPAAMAEELKSLTALRKGRPVEIDGEQVTPRSTEKVKPAPDGDIEAAKAELPASIRDMVDLQILTGMRPGEVCALTRAYLDTTDPTLWVCRPPHKTEHHDIEREIDFGVRCIEILKRHLPADLNAPMFSPAKAWAERQERKRSLYVPPENANGDYRNWASFKNRVRKGRGGVRWNVDAYRRAIARACKEAGVPEWSPNQLRHNFATKWRPELGLETMQALLGHAKLETTQVYADKLREKARDAMRRIG